MLIRKLNNELKYSNIQSTKYHLLFVFLQINALVSRLWMSGKERIVHTKEKIVRLKNISDYTESSQVVTLRK